MAKVVKINRSNLNEIIKNVLEEQESLSDIEKDDVETNDETEDDFESFEDPKGVELHVALDQFGNYYIVDKDGNIVTKTK